MANFTTWVLGCALALATMPGAFAQPSARPLELAPDAPDRHVVVKGDTLWDISAKFLRSPWRWPEIWQLNREQIRNPHLIYPGDIVYLDHSGGAPRLRLGREVGGSGSGAGGADPRAGRDYAAGTLGRTRAEPLMRATPLDRAPIPTVSSADIGAFLNRPLIVEPDGLAKNPRIVATQEGRVYLGPGDTAYVRGIQDDGIVDWHIYRATRPLLDPDTRKPIAHEALFVGSAQLVRNGDPATIRIVGAAEEIGEGDRLIPAERGRVLHFVPRAPDASVQGRIVAVYRGVSQVGRNNVVALNVGRKHGLDVGHVLAVQANLRKVVDRETRDQIQLPLESVGTLLVFRVFDQIAYGLVMEASRSLSVGDAVANP
ncbi:MAG TPA: LysM domain-containing protein [Burkholderiaceae bacterium]|nr:LysM domain-containing protein [Burkholderiaceae bacterium]